MLPMDNSIEERVNALLTQMTWEEKVAQLGSKLPFTDWGEFYRLGLEGKIAHVKSLPVEDAAKQGQLSIYLRELPPREAARLANVIYHYAREQTRLGIPPIIHDEGLHGLLANDATSFPQSIGMASSWQPELLEEVAQAIGREARARGIRQLLSPTINIARDPRCGRTEETYGEDPYLAAQMAVAFVRGVQSQGVVTTPKHYAANFVGDGGRDSFAIHFSERLMREVYLPAFKAAVRQGGALSIMAAYNTLDGLPCSCNPWLLTKLLREEWGFEGFVVSDYGSVVHILEKHQVAADKTEVARRAVEAGLDVELPATDCYGEPLLRGIQDGMISKEAVNEAVRRVLRVKLRLGLLDDPFVDEEEAKRISHCQEHQELALKMARQAMVLLKNDGATLPIPADIRSLAVIGPLADEPALGGYSWDGYPKGWVITPLEGIRSRLGDRLQVHYAQGCTVTGEIAGGIASAVRLASQCQMAVLVMGNTHKTEGEQKDRASLDLPGVQPELIKAVAGLGIPAAVVLINGSAITMTDWIERVGAVLEAWYPGEKGGLAIAEALSGEVNPGGKLPITFPRTVGQLPLYYNHKPSGRINDYVDLSGKPLFPFGHGLSYTTFEYRGLDITVEGAGDDRQVKVSLEVVNTGKRSGDEVVQLYIHDRVASVARPVKELKAFRRISLDPGQAKTVAFTLPVQQFGLYDAALHFVVEPGEFEIMIGSSSEDIRLYGVLVL